MVHQKNPKFAIILLNTMKDHLLIQDKTLFNEALNIYKTWENNHD